MFGMKLLEGKDAMNYGPALEFSFCTKTAASLLRLCESMFSTGKVVILDRGFCALKASIPLFEYGACTSALTKKRRHWLACTKGDKSNEYFPKKPIGYQD